ncbi:MAG: ADP-ribosylglycohydrolase family protein [Clostridiales bacterium]|nr:ADP-ribosylglycohydrolase family protein [Clostridiales bacterium]MCF8023768.1 ADP-ribosylglycohydrolase family protein [Clostridiales bacterium]
MKNYIKGTEEVELMEEFIRGAFYGAAIGDALGGPVEYMNKEEIEEKYGVLKNMVGGGKMNLQPGEFSDDTHLLLQVAKGIQYNSQSPVEEIGRRFLKWYRSRPECVGKTTRKAFDNYLNIGNWNEAARITSRSINKVDSNGGLMRTLAITFGYMNKTALMAYWSKEIANMTHHSEEGAACCIFYNYLVLLAGTLKLTRREMITMAVEYTDKQCKRLNLYPSNFFWYLIASIQPGAEEIYPRGNVLDTLVTSVQCFLCEDSFESTLTCAVNRGEDTDTAGTVTGGLAGAYYGYSDIPQQWIDELKDKEILEDVIDGFL